MISHEFDPKKPYQVYTYARMSSDQQNPRSPDQQLIEIENLIQKLGYPWEIVESFRDDAASGKYAERNRPGFQRMLTNIRTGVGKVDLILVDTYERLGRNISVAPIVQELSVEHGVLILTVQESFGDPTTPQGEMLKWFDDTRARADNRTKSHQVTRGKRDVVRSGYWPGGAPPFGYRLKSSMEINQGNYSLKGSKLEIDPTEGPIVQKLFKRAAETAHGPGRLARWMNDLPEMPDRYKPVHQSTVRYWLNHSIYRGVLIWGKQQADICKDVRVIRSRPESDWTSFDQFCEPLVSEELFREVQELALVRRNSQKVPEDQQSGKLIPPIANGISLVYPLSGLVVCGECGGHMRPVTSGRKSKSGKSYMYYACETASVSKACLNRAHVPESWLRGVVIEKVQERILGMKVGDLNLVAGSSPLNSNEDESDLGKATFELNDVTNLPWFTELFDIVSDEFKNLKGDQESAMIALQQEAKKLDNQIKGWILSLASLELPMDTRKLLGQEIDAASNRKQELQNIIERQNSALAGWNSMVTHGAVLQRLQKLASVLGKLNASRINVELSLHIDRISCYRDGHVCLRLCRLGLAPDIIDVLQLYQMEPGQETTPTLITPRRRSRRRISTGEAPSIELNALTIWAAEPQRFKGLPACFFEEHDFNRPEPEFWYQQHAKAIAEKRKMGMSHDELAELFDSTATTIRKALKHAMLSDPELAELPAKRARPRWHEEKVGEVLELFKQGLNIPRISERLGKSEPTIRKAIEYAQACGLIPLQNSE